MATSFSQEAVEGDLPSGYIRLYHYTDLKGFIGICKRKEIWKSTAQTSSDAFYGEGTYLTDKAPEKHTKLEIAKDIWVNADRLHAQMVEEGRTDFVLVVVIKRSMVESSDPEHHIWLYPGQDLELNDKSVVYAWSVGQTTDEERHSYEENISAANLRHTYP